VTDHPDYNKNSIYIVFVFWYFSFVELTKQRVIIHFLVKLGKTAQEIQEMINIVYADNVVQKTSLVK